MNDEPKPRYRHCPTLSALREMTDQKCSGWALMRTRNADGTVPMDEGIVPDVLKIYGPTGMEYAKAVKEAKNRMKSEKGTLYRTVCLYGPNKEFTL